MESTRHRGGRTAPGRLRLAVAAAAVLTAAPAVPAGSTVESAGSPEVAVREAIAAIGAPEARRAIGGVATRAIGVGPRGSFVTEIVALADGTTRFVQTSGGATTELLVTGGRVFARGADGRFEEAPAAALEVAHGHAVQRLLLDLDLSPAGELRPDGCQERIGPDDLALVVCAEGGSGPVGRLEIALAGSGGGERIVVELDDWRRELDVSLPRLVTFVQGGDRFVHRIVALHPFRLAPGTSLPAEPAALAGRLADLAALAASHAGVIEAHLRGDVDRLLADAAEIGTVARRGELVETSREQTRERLGAYLAATRFQRYQDVVVPVVGVAHDGSLGWLGCQIEAEGEQRDAEGRVEPFAYGFSWVELFARGPEGWRNVGNASSPRP